MRSSKRAGFWTLVAMFAVTIASSPTFAMGGGSWGSWGSSHGSHGSHGSWGSYGSCGGGLFRGRRPVRNLLGRIGNRLFHGSSGYASSGGYAYGSCGYSSVGTRYGSWGSTYIAGGSSGYSTHYYPAVTYTSGYTPTLTSADPCDPCTMSMQPAPADGTPVQGNSIPNYYEQPVEGGFDAVPNEVPSNPNSPAGAGSEGGEPAVGAGESTRLNRPDESVLALGVPKDSVVLINGQRTKTTGSLRRYVAKKMNAEQEYRYDVEVQFEKNGQLLKRTDSVVLQPGFEHRLAFDFKPVPTTLTVEVPEGARLELCGVSTKAKGKRRSFTTEELAEGERWQDYTVKVEYERNGVLLTKTETIAIEGGQDRHLKFDFDGNQIASR